MKKLTLALLVVICLTSAAYASDAYLYLPEYQGKEVGPLWAIFFKIFELNIKYITKLYGLLMEYFKYPFRIILLAYIFYVAKCVSADGFGKAKELVYTCLSVAFMYSALLEWEIYGEYVVKTILLLGIKLSGFFISISDMNAYADPRDVFVALDKLALQFFHGIESAAPEGNFLVNAGRYVSYAIAAVPLFVLFAAMYMAFFIIFTIAFFGIFILLVIGGPILLLAAIKEMRTLLWAWLRGIANYLLLAIFVSIIMGITLMGLIESMTLFHDNAANGFGFLNVEYLKLLIWCGFSLGMLLKAPDFAAHMSGAAAGSTSGIAGGLSAVSGVFAGSALSFGRKGASRGMAAIGKASTGAKGYVGDPTELLRKMRGARD